MRRALHRLAPLRPARQKYEERTRSLGRRCLHAAAAVLPRSHLAGMRVAQGQRTRSLGASKCSLSVGFAATMRHVNCSPDVELGTTTLPERGSRGSGVGLGTRPPAIHARTRTHAHAHAHAQFRWRTRTPCGGKPRAWQAQAVSVRVVESDDHTAPATSARRALAAWLNMA